MLPNTHVPKVTTIPTQPWTTLQTVLIVQLECTVRVSNLFARIYLLLAFTMIHVYRGTPGKLAKENLKQLNVY